MPLTGKLITARWVCAPNSASAGTRISPSESFSVRYSCVIALCLQNSFAESVLMVARNGICAVRNRCVIVYVCYDSTGMDTYRQYDGLLPIGALAHLPHAPCGGAQKEHSHGTRTNP